MTIRTSSARLTLFDQVGGFDGVEAAVSRLFERLAGEPMLAALAAAGADVDLRWQVQLLLTDIFGGPMAYDGPDPAVVAGRLALDGAAARLLIDRLLDALEAGGSVADRVVLRSRLEEFAGRIGVRCEAPAAGLAAPVPVAAPAMAPVAAPVDPKDALVNAGLQAAAATGVAIDNLFILDREFAIVHLNAGAARAVSAADGDLRRAFNHGAADLPGMSILRFHSAPTRLQAVLSDPARLPHTTTWSFGQTVWLAEFRQFGSSPGDPEGYLVLWRDESELHRAQAVFQRLRSQAEDLPVPVMYPDQVRDRWLGNAACEHALERLARYLPGPVNPLEGVPISLFFPDAAERLALFRSPDLLPHKRQLQIGPETIAILVTPVFDADQRYLGPQITWEIVHFTDPALRNPPSRPVAPVAPLPAAPGPALSPPGANQASPTSAGAAATPHAAAALLRAEARAVEAASSELQRLIRLIDAAADAAEGHGHLTPSADGEPLPEAIRLAEAAVEVLRTAREAPVAPGRREAVTRALETISDIARRTNQLALDAALLAVQDDAMQAADGLREDARSFAVGLRERIEVLGGRTERSAESLRQAMTTAARLEQLRAQFADRRSTG